MKKLWLDECYLCRYFVMDSLIYTGRWPPHQYIVGPPFAFSAAAIFLGTNTRCWKVMGGIWHRDTVQLCENLMVVNPAAGCLFQFSIGLRSGNCGGSFPRVSWYHSWTILNSWMAHCLLGSCNHHWDTPSTWPWSATILMYVVLLRQIKGSMRKTYFKS